MSDLRADVEAAVHARQPIPIGGGEIRFLCIAHEDHNPSARWNSEKGTWHCDVCGAGGGYVDLAKRLGLNLNGHGGGKPKGGKGKVVAQYAYVDEEGDLLFQVVRFEPKDFRQRKPDGNGGWVWSLKGTRRVLYHLPEVLRAVGEKRFILQVEGEKDVESLRKLGFTATTNPQGAAKWQKTYTDTLRGARVALIPDRDEAGKKHQEIVTRELLGSVSELRVIKLPSGKDVSDWLAAGGTAEELKKLVRTAKPVKPEPEDSRDAELELLREKVRRLEGQNLVEEGASRARILETLSDQLGIQITGIVEYDQDDPQYEIKIGDKRVQVGPIGSLIEQKPLRHLIAAASHEIIRTFSKEAWLAITKLMMRAVEVRHIEEATAFGTLDRYLRAYLAAHPVPPEDQQEAWQKLASEGMPFRRDGDLHIGLESLRIFIVRSLNEPATIPELATLFNRFALKSKKMSGRHPQTNNVFSRKFWVLPEWVVQPLSDDTGEKSREREEERESALF